MAVKIMPVTDLRQKITSVLKELEESGQPLYITQYGRPKAVLLSYEGYEALIRELEDLEDSLSIYEGKGEPSRPYEEFIAEVSAPAGVQSKD